MKKFLVSLFLCAGITVNAQDYTSSNLIGPDNLTGTVSTDSAGGGYSGGFMPGYNYSTNTILFGYTQSTVAYTYALSQALQSSGLIFTGYNYSWEYLNHGEARGTLSADVNFIGLNGAILYTRNWHLGNSGANWQTVSGTETFTSSILTSNLANFSLSFTGQDDRFWAGYYGPQVRDASLSINYTFDACATNPLSSSTCPGYETAYLTQQCTVSALYSPSCPGYAVAYLDQQCAANPLYSTTCFGYAEAYAKKNILNTKDNNTIVLAQADTTSMTLVSDPIVNKTITTQSTTANAEANPAAPVKLTAPAATASSVTDSTTNKKSDSGTGTADTKSNNKPKTAREALAEKQREKAREEAVARGKELANEIGKATDMAAQIAVQNVVIQAMGYTPGFDTYARLLPDTQFYQPHEAYAGQRTIDAPSGRGLFGGSDNVHQRMVDQQYNLGK